MIPFFHRHVKVFCFFIIFVMTFISGSIFAAEKQYVPDSRAQLPHFLNNTYMGFGIGYTDIPFSNADLINGFQASSFDNPSVGLNVFIGHFFNRYFALQASLMRPIKWAYARGVATPSDKHSIWISLFGLSVRPTLPLSDKVSLYGTLGAGFASRHGFKIGPTTAIHSEDVMTLLTGGGLTYAFTKYWHLNFGLQYSFARESKEQPHILYAYASFYYLFHKLHLPDHYNANYIVHKNLIQLGGFSTDVFDPKVNKYFSIGYLPIFWKGDVKLRNGEMFMYERNIFHTHKIFSFDLGMSVSNYNSKINDTNFQDFAVFPVFRFWLVRSHKVDFYFAYTLAGPSYITRAHIDGLYTGGHFTFQDLLGFGVFLGHEKNWNIDLKIAHYSNGNLLPNNPGIEIPVVVSLGYGF